MNGRTRTPTMSGWRNDTYFKGVVRVRGPETIETINGKTVDGDTIDGDVYRLAVIGVLFCGAPIPGLVGSDNVLCGPASLLPDALAAIQRGHARIRLGGGDDVITQACHAIHPGPRPKWMKR
jgi:hypothetical protein